VVKEGSNSVWIRCKDSIGRVRAFFGNFLVMVRAYAYILEMVNQGILDVTQHAVLNAN
jgi:glycine dehydrogenase subunit 2